MKKLFLITTLCLFSSLSWGQRLTSLPLCPPYKDSWDWHNCFGEWASDNGDVYVGEWKDGDFNGRGTFTWANGDAYVGEWKDGLNNGSGTYTWADGDVYVGQFKDSKKTGYGRITFGDGDPKFAGDVYVGQFKDDKRHGQGTYTHSDGVKHTGTFEYGKLNGEGTIIWSENLKYAGSFIDHKPYGIGICTTPEGSYNCGWNNGELQPYDDSIQSEKTKRSFGSKLGSFLAEAFIEGISKSIQVAIINEFNEPCEPTVRVKTNTIPMRRGLSMTKTRVKVKTCPTQYYFLD